MQPNNPVSKKKAVSGERPVVPHRKPRQPDADETASKRGFPGQGDQRTHLDPDGNHAQAGKAPPQKTGDSK
jgi:hypothetical protein